ncbi:phage holin family protein [Blautia sp. LMAG:75]|uniref:phage holin family protein n=1 Tax=Blautia sp. LMAG:75 TaxID=1969171 RepID=UPI0025C1992D|nr:phage holin family protein [Blautia sp. LMAG:75]
MMTKLSIITRLWSHITDLRLLIRGQGNKTLSQIEEELDLTEYYRRPYADADDVDKHNEIRAGPKTVLYYCKNIERDEEMKRMEKLFNWISVIGGVIGGFLAYWLGGWDALLKTIVCLAVLDYITGWIKAVYNKQLSSEIGFKGLLKKIVMFIVIAVSYAIQGLMGGKVPLREVVIMFYIANEALSLLENAAEFIPVPDKLKEVLLQLRDKDSEGE